MIAAIQCGFHVHIYDAVNRTEKDGDWYIYP